MPMKEATIYIVSRTGVKHIRRVIGPEPYSARRIYGLCGMGVKPEEALASVPVLRGLYGY
jgi:hypothetical protein